MSRTDILRPTIAAGTLDFVDEDLISRGELTATLFAIQDIRQDVHEILNRLEDEDDGEAPEADA